MGTNATFNISYSMHIIFDIYINVNFMKLDPQ